jgi:hypothetical protein
VLNHLDLFKSKTSKMMIKTSPLLDISLVLKQLPYVYEIHIVAHKNEIKELLLILDFVNHHPTTTIKAVNLETEQDTFSCKADDVAIKQNISFPSTYLYEPNAAIMKSGCFGVLCNAYNVSALSSNSHLFTTKHLIDFPGRRFMIKHIISPKLKEIHKHIPTQKANIATRNFPLNPQQIKTKFKLKDGGSNFVFFTENMNKEKIVLICHKIKP